jgi:hypothetical protein
MMELGVSETMPNILVAKTLDDVGLTGYSPIRKNPGGVHGLRVPKERSNPLNLIRLIPA